MRFRCRGIAHGHLGFRSLSVSSGELLEVKNVIRSTRIDRAESLATKILALSTVQEIKACLHDAGISYSQHEPAL